MITPKFDPTINLGHILTIGAFMLGGIGAWYNLNEKVSALKVETDLKFAQSDRNVAEIKDAIKENKHDIQQEIRDFKNDLRGRPMMMAPK